MDIATVSIVSLSAIFLSTVAGSSLVFLFRNGMGKRMSSVAMGFAGGVMIAASFFGLIMPSVESAGSIIDMIPSAIGFLLGGALMWMLDITVPHIHGYSGTEEGAVSNIDRRTKLFLAVTLHNIPEGLSVGFACGLAMSIGSEEAMYAALSLAAGIAIQNLPEGAAVSMMMLSNGMGRIRAFVFGSLSGIVEPLFGIIGMALSFAASTSPLLLAFAAGAMIYITLDEIIPEAMKEGLEHIGMWAFMVGFVMMMLLETRI